MNDQDDLARLRAEQITLLKAYRGKLIRAIEKLDPDEAKFADVAAGLRLVSQHLEALPSESGERRAESGEPQRNAAGDGAARLRLLLPNDEDATAGGARRQPGAAG